MHKFNLSFKQGDLDEIENRQRGIYRNDKKVHLPKVSIVILNTSNPEVFAVCHAHDYSKNKELMESLGFSVARKVDIVVRRSLSSVRP